MMPTQTGAAGTHIALWAAGLPSASHLEGQVQHLRSNIGQVPLDIAELLKGLCENQLQAPRRQAQPSLGRDRLAPPLLKSLLVQADDLGDRPHSFATSENPVLMHDLVATSTDSVSVVGRLDHACLEAAVETRGSETTYRLRLLAAELASRPLSINTLRVEVPPELADLEVQKGNRRS